jgi:hypothetical protein
VLTDITLDGSAVIARAPDTVADVYAGSPVVAAVQLGAGERVVRGRTADGVWERRLRVGMPRPGDGDPAIAALFGRERIADLEARGVAGENRNAEIEHIGLAFQIATRFTPFIAIDESRNVHPAVVHRAVPQELPHGTTAAAFGLRAAATAPVDGVPGEFADVDTARTAQGVAAHAGALAADFEELERALVTRPSLLVADNDDLDELQSQFEAIGRSAAARGFAIDAPDDDYVDAEELFVGREDAVEDAVEDAMFPGEEDEKELVQELVEELVEPEPGEAAAVTAKLPAQPGREPTPPASAAPRSPERVEPRDAPELRDVPRHPRRAGGDAAPAVPPAVRKSVLRCGRPLLLVLLAVAAVLAALLWWLVR